MLSPTPAQLKKLEKLAKVLDNGDIALLTELDALESRLEGLETIVPALREAQDGYTPVKGVDYRDGVDGYTPIKGVDYFDGKDGRDGVDSTVPGPRGEKGDTGPQGIPGVDGRDGADGFVDEATVAYLEEEVKKAKLDKEAYDRALGIVDQRTSFSINKASNLERDKITGVGVHTITVSDTAPDSPATGDLWVDTDATPSGGSSAWGGITGTLSDQTDLQTALGNKANSADLATVATSGDYDDLINKPSGLTAQQVASLISIRF